DVASGAASVTSNAVTIGAAPTKLVFTTQPGNSTAGQPIAGPVVVKIEYANGTVVHDNAPVTLSVATGPGTLYGTYTVNAVNGVATFNNAVLITSGNYVLAAADALDLLTGFNSSAFSVTVAAATQLFFEQQPTNTVAGALLSPTLAVAI